MKLPRMNTSVVKVYHLMILKRCQIWWIGCDFTIVWTRCHWWKLWARRSKNSTNISRLIQIWRCHFQVLHFSKFMIQAEIRINHNTISLSFQSNVESCWSRIAICFHLQWKIFSYPRTVPIKYDWWIKLCISSSSWFKWSWKSLWSSPCTKREQADTCSFSGFQQVNICYSH